jgi:hypothetical protein
VLNQRLWFWVQLLVELAVGAYVLYRYFRVLPALERASAGRFRAAPRPGSRGLIDDTLPAPPRPVLTTGRRDARRDRKRKGR